ncbi:MAG: autoinducer binding domain-containing protein [Pseudomonadota bacterium]
MREAIDLLAHSGRADLASDLHRVLETSDFSDTEMLRSAEADQLLNSIVEADMTSDLILALEQLRDILAVDHCTVHIVKEAPGHFFRTRVLTTYPDSWIERYVSAKFDMLDPVLSYSQMVSEGFFWDEMETTAPVIKSFFQEAGKFGIGPSGHTTLVTTETGEIFGLSVTSTMDQEAFRMHLDRNLPDITVLASYLSEAFVRLLSNAERSRIQLSNDQILVLRGIAEGMTWEEVSEIADKFGSFQEVARSICEAFDTNTIVQAAIYAARLGLLDVPPLTIRNVFTATSRGTDGELFQADNIASLRRWARVKKDTKKESQIMTLVALPAEP